MSKKKNQKNIFQTYNIWMFEDGHIARRETELGHVMLKVSTKPELVKAEEDQIPVITPKPLDWKKDIQLRSIYRQVFRHFSLIFSNF